MSFWNKLFSNKFPNEKTIEISDEKKKMLEDSDRAVDRMIEEYETRYKEKLLIINLPTDKRYDSHYEEYPAIIYYNKADLQECIGEYSEDNLCIIDLWKLMDVGNVAIYSGIENRLVSEIKREVYDNDFERRIRYYLPDGTRFVDAKTACKTP